MKLKLIYFLFLIFGIISCNRGEQNHPVLLTLEYEHLVEIKKAIQENSPKYMAAYNRLLKEADLILNQPCYSVINKTTTPPSGDKKDYISLATYWWPDLETPDGLPYIRKDGLRNPEGNELRFDDQRSSQMVENVCTLTLAWFYTNNKDYAQKAAEMIHVWFLKPETSMNPNLNFAQAIPGKVDGRGVGIIDTRNYVRITDAVKLLQQSNVWKQKNTKELQSWFASYLDWLINSENGIDESKRLNNHGTWYDVQLSCYADFIGDSELAKRVIEQAAKKRIEVQIDSLGRQALEISRTRSFRYSVMNLEGLCLLGKMGEMYDVDLWHYQSAQKGSMRKACDYIFTYVDDFGSWPYQQITAFDWLELVPLTKECCRIYKDDKYDYYLGLLTKEIKPTDRLILTKL